MISSAAPVTRLDAGDRIEAGEDLPGGTATSHRGVETRDAFSHPSTGLDLESELKFKLGNAIFRRLWVAAPTSTRSADGLGPLYNARACQNCHPKDGRGRPPDPNAEKGASLSLLLRLSVPPENEDERRRLSEGRDKVIGDPVYGTQLQTLGVQGHEGEGQIRVVYTDEPLSLGDGTLMALRRPSYAIVSPQYGPLHPRIMVSPRVAPPMIGLGLLEAIDEHAIRAREDPNDRDGDGISGVANEVWSVAEGGLRLGRFGWKAGEASVREQSASAAAFDIGLSNPIFPLEAGDCTRAQKSCLKAPHGGDAKSGDFELGAELLELLTFYAQNVAVPARRNASDARVLKGKELFAIAGCAGCHVPSFATGAVKDQPQLSGQRIWPYSDLLLHDMGEGLADGRPEGKASGREWRTAPLWGIGLTQVVSGHTFLLHDGRARNVEEAILWHGGEAKAARDAFAQLTREERDALVAFVKSL